MKNNKADQYQDIITNRVLTMFGATVVFLWAMSYLSRGFDYTRSYKTAVMVSLILIFVGAFVAVGGFFWQLHINKQKEKSDRGVYGWLTCWFGVALAVSSGMMRYIDYVATMRVLYIVMPVAAVLFLVYYTYQREFFTLSLVQSLSTLAFWVIAKSDNGVGSWSAIVALVVALLACLATMTAFSLGKKSGGLLSLGNKKVRVFGAKTSGKLVYCVVGLTAVLLIAAFVFGSPYAYYMMYAVLACLFVEAICFTVAMM